MQLPGFSLPSLSVLPGATTVPFHDALRALAALSLNGSTTAFEPQPIIANVSYGPEVTATPPAWLLYDQYLSHLLLPAVDRITQTRQFSSATGGTSGAAVSRALDVYNLLFRLLVSTYDSNATVTAPTKWGVRAAMFRSSGVPLPQQTDFKLALGQRNGTSNSTPAFSGGSSSGGSGPLMLLLSTWTSSESMVEWFERFGLDTAQPSFRDDSAANDALPATEFLRGGSSIRRGVNILAQLDVSATSQLSTLARFTGSKPFAAPTPFADVAVVCMFPQRA
jgi:hypothetical protein